MSKGASIAVQLVLVLVIAGLGYFLYESITSPWEERERIIEQREERAPAHVGRSAGADPAQPGQ